MRIGRKWAGLVLAATALLTGCSGFWDPQNGGGGGGGSVTGVFYVMNTGTGQIVAYGFNSGSSTPVQIGNAVALGVTPLAMAIAPAGNFLYVSTGNGILAYSIASGGGLTLLNNNQAISGDLPTSMAVDSTGTWLIETTQGLGTISAVPISATTGILDSTRTAQLANLPSNASVQQIAASPANAATPAVFIAAGSIGTVVIPFTAATTTASPNPFGTTATTYHVKNTSGSDLAVAVDPSYRFVYVGETLAVSGSQTGGMRVYSVGNGAALTEVSGSPFATAGTGPAAIRATANNVFVANKAVSGGSTGNITGFPINSNNGAYSIGSIINTISAGNNTVGLGEDSTGTYLLAVNSAGNPDLNVYTFDATTAGKLVAGPKVTTGTDPVNATAVVAVP